MYSHDRAAINNLHISYSKQLFSREGHIYYYSILWDEICKQVPALEECQAIRHIY